jgi:histidinol-phosphate aminotransferase
MTHQLEDLVRLVRPEVRRSREYVVGGPGAGQSEMVKLNQNECPERLPPEVRDDLRRAIEDISVNRYPAEAPTELRRALAETVGHPETGIIVGNGSNELTYTLGMTFVGPGTPVVVPRPMFALYESMVRLHGGVVVPVAPLPNLAFDMEGVLAAVARTNAPLTILTTPNNPTGLALTRDEVIAVLEESNGIVVVDEAYVEFNPNGTVLDLIERFPNLIVLRTLSKAFGLAGLRVGFLMGHPRLVSEMMKSRLPFMVDRIAESVALSLLRRPGLVERRIADIKRWTAGLTREMSEMDLVDVIPSSTNFVLFRSNQDPATLVGRLADLGILVRGMQGYPELTDYLRVTSGTEHENRLFLNALNAAVAAGATQAETLSEHD